MDSRQGESKWRSVRLIMRGRMAIAFPMDSSAYNLAMAAVGNQSVSGDSGKRSNSKRS